MNSAHVGIATFLTGTMLLAQAPEPAFEVVSIKRSTSLSTGGGGGPRPGGRYVMTNIPPRSLIGAAYGIPSNRVLSVPLWGTEERYDIEARAPMPNPTQDETTAMLRTLLRDRFKLSVRRETRDLPVYGLVMARTDGTLGPRLRSAAVNCQDPEARKQAAAVAKPGSFGPCGFRDNSGRLEGRGLTLDTLAQILVGPAGRPVVNKTGLTGMFDVDLEWAATLDAAEAVPIFTAVQEQLGLKLQNDTAPMEVVIVDRIERPSEN